MERDLDKLAADQAPQVARYLRGIAQRGGTEADFRREAAQVFEERAAAVGLTITPRDEYHVARGNVDTLYNRLVLEYKKPGWLRPANAAAPNRKAIDQVKGYILDVAVRERLEAHRLAGVITDGLTLSSFGASARDRRWTKRLPSIRLQPNRFSGFSFPFPQAQRLSLRT